MIQTISRVNLVIGAVVLAAYGVVFFAQPSALAGLVGLEFTSPDAPVEIRAFYAGAARVLGVLQYGAAGSAPLVVAGVELFVAALSAWLLTWLASE